MREIGSSELRLLDAHEAWSIRGGDAWWPFQCVSIACSAGGAAIRGAIIAVLEFDMPASSYAYGKCGM